MTRWTPTTRRSLPNRIWTKRREIWVKIQQEVLGGGYMIKIADTGRLIGYAKKLKGQSDYAGILQLWDLWLE